jgi:hypothetical protein
MSDSSLALQSAIQPILVADGTLTALAANRIYDSVPGNATFPYLTLGEDHVIADRADCIDGAEVFVTIHAWSRPVSPGWAEVKQIAAAVAAALDQSLPDIGAQHAVVTFEHEDTRYLRDPDGVTRHAVITFRVLTDAV